MRSIRYGLIGAVAAAVVVAACGDGTREAIESERRSASLVVGSAAAEWGLLTIPRRGGTPDVRPVMNPDSVVWNGSTELPVARDVWALGEAAVVLLAEDGRLIRYDPVEDEATELAELSAEARLSGTSASAVVFLDSAGRFAYEIGGDYTHGYRLPREADWAGPVEGGLAALTAGEPGDLLLLQRSDSTAAVEIADAGRPPALVTAWGRRVVLAGPSGRTVRVYATDASGGGGDAAGGRGGGPIGEVEVGGPVAALAASPSSHEIYAALESPPRIERISRFSLETGDVVELPAPADRLRPGLFGGSLIARTAGGAVRIRTGAAEAASIEGQWRSDLPLGLPGDLSIALVDDEARLVSVVDSAGATLADGAPRWWNPVRFNPAAAHADVLAEALDELGAEAGAPGEAASGEPEAEGAETAAEEGAEVPEVESAGADGPPGYYAIVASTRQRSGVESLLAELDDAGYPTRVQTWPDEAGQEWHRGLVGPFPSRARARAAARQLLRERGLQAWVTEIGRPE